MPSFKILSFFFLNILKFLHELDNLFLSNATHFCVPTGLELYPSILLHAENIQCHQQSLLKHISLDPRDSHSPAAHPAQRGV